MFDFGTAAIGMIPLVPFIMGLVAWIKTMGLTGKLLTLISMLLGLVLGVLYMHSQAPLVGFGAWFVAVVYGLTLGMAASGVYDLGHRDFKQG